MSAYAAPRRIVAWLAEGLASIGPKADLVRALQDVARAAGAKHAAFIMRHAPGVVGDDPFHADTFGDAWRRHAAIQDYHPADFACVQSERLMQPFDWSELPRGRGRLKRFLRDIHEFQLGRQALTATFRGPLGDRSQLTLTSDATEKRWQIVKHDVAAAMAALHPAFHAAVLRIRFDIEDFGAPKLTPREKQCLAWAAHGRTSREIAEGLGLTTATVNFFVDAALGKLSASNRTHAVAKALAMGLIAPPR